MGKLALPLECFKVVENTTSMSAKEVVKHNGEVYRVQRKPYIELPDGSQMDIDKTHILKSYEKEDGEIALFTKEEQSELLKKGSSREWVVDKVIDQDQFDELSFQKDGYILKVAKEKDKSILNQRNNKFYAMLKVGLGEKAIITQILFKNVEYPVAITNYGNDLLVRFLRYKSEIREIVGEEIVLTEEEHEKAKTFITQYYNPDFKVDSYVNTTEEKVMELINSKGEIDDSEMVEMLIEENNPFD